MFKNKKKGRKGLKEPEASKKELKADDAPSLDEMGGMEDLVLNTTKEESIASNQTTKKLTFQPQLMQNMDGLIGGIHYAHADPSLPPAESPRKLKPSKMAVVPATDVVPADKIDSEPAELKSARASASRFKKGRVKDQRKKADKPPDGKTVKAGKYKVAFINANQVKQADARIPLKEANVEHVSNVDDGVITASVTIESVGYKTAEYQEPDDPLTNPPKTSDLNVAKVDENGQPVQELVMEAQLAGVGNKLTLWDGKVDSPRKAVKGDAMVFKVKYDDSDPDGEPEIGIPEVHAAVAAVEFQMGDSTLDPAVSPSKAKPSNLQVFTLNSDTQVTETEVQAAIDGVGVTLASTKRLEPIRDATAADRVKNAKVINADSKWTTL